MNMQNNKRKRREFLLDSLRLGALGFLGLITGSAILKKDKNKESDNCINLGICDGCSRYNGCKLPQALSRKKHFSENEDGRK